jgi:cytochrome b involved in lipid metabolism
MRFLALLLVLTLAGCASASEVENVESSANSTEVQVESTVEPSSEESPLEDAGSAEAIEEDVQTEAANPSPTPSETKVTTPAPKPTASPKPEDSPSSPAPAEKPSGYTTQEVASKNSRSACWVIVSGGVYDLTDWIAKHPGGSGAITNLCGADATDAFEGKHGGEARPSAILNGYYLAPLVD